MEQEYSSLIDNGMWELVDLPPDRVVVKNYGSTKSSPTPLAMSHASKHG
jgi:hypothetical protein